MTEGSYLSDYVHLSFKRDEARVRKSSSTTGTKSTLLKLEIEVFDPYTLSMLIQSIQEAMRPAPAVKAPAAPIGRKREERRLLPAPLLRLEPPRG